MASLTFDYTGLQRVHLGSMAADVLSGELQSDPDARIYAIVSGTLSRQTALTDDLQRALGDRLAGVFDTMGAHTPRTDVLRALAQARAVNADILLAVGGGSMIDACKVIQFCLNAGIESEAELLRHAQFSNGLRGDLCGTEPPLQRQHRVYQIAVPTTLSAAEFSNNAGVTDTAKGAKEGYKAPGLAPRQIVYDPVLALHTPSWLWLSTAIRALDHAIEGYCSADAHAFVQGHYLHAMRLFAESLPAMKADPGNLEARSRNQQATWLAGCGLGRIAHGASHGIGYILGAMCGVPHGHTSCVMLPAVLRWNEAANSSRQREIGLALGAQKDSTADFLHRWLQDLELPVSLRDVGVKADQLPAIAAAAAQHRVVRANPRTISGADDVMEILQLAW
ncbi:MAG: alcohol dehydrogenase [Gammaproteobacteria bacterium]|nr:alcohol dehydrogenase [Gammaproteobacteria bacterium]|tara:strand:- start:2059 stop:3237 length:1179 start_codon:yes stop_codon:yes gene_type:complete